MRELLAYSTFAVTIGVAITRPQLTARWQVGPGAAALGGMLVLIASGIVGAADLVTVGGTLWRPFLSIVATMLMTASAERMGLPNRLALGLFGRPSLSIGRLYLSVFILSAATSSLLNNDAAVLLLTPPVLALVQMRYPGQRALLVPFAFAVFAAAGVAPLVVSNPVNMIVASAAGLDFNTYAARMIPISLAGWIIAFVMLRLLFASRLATAVASGVAAPGRVSRAQRQIVLVLFAALGSYPLVAMIDPTAIWLVSAAGAALAVAVACRCRTAQLGELMARGVAWDILVFLVAVFVIAIGLRNVGLVGHLSALYAGAGIGVVGTTAALGSAVLNNHPMAILNVLALEGAPQAGQREILAALIGGDLGPRLLPIGSLAGLLWLDSCRRAGVEIPVRQFVGIGMAVTIPALAVSLAILALLR